MTVIAVRGVRLITEGSTYILTDGHYFVTFMHSCKAITGRLMTNGE